MSGSILLGQAKKKVKLRNNVDNWRMELGQFISQIIGLFYRQELVCHMTPWDFHTSCKPGSMNQVNESRKI